MIQIRVFPFQVSELDEMSKALRWLNISLSHLQFTSRNSSVSGSPEKVNSFRHQMENCNLSLVSHWIPFECKLLETKFNTVALQLQSNNFCLGGRCKHITDRSSHYHFGNTDHTIKGSHRQYKKTGLLIRYNHHVSIFSTISLYSFSYNKR